jgi:hypothetical protein
MNLLPVRFALLIACLALRLAAADTPASAAADQKKLEEAIRVRLADHALHKASRAAPPADTATATTATGATAQPGGTAAATPATTATPAGTPAAAPKDEAATQLPRVEVNKSRITELAIALHEKDIEIAREKKAAKPTGLDESMNDPEVAHSLSIFGGASSEDRARLSQERISLLEAEKEIIEEIDQARNKEERDELKKMLNDLKTMRRDLERAPRDERK